MPMCEEVRQQVAYKRYGMRLLLQVGVRVHTPVSACASGAEAIGYAFEMIKNNRADIIVTGGVEAAIHQLPMAGFAAMKALSTRNDAPTRASRPYDLDRDGFVLGEGGGILVIEEYEHAKARGAKIYCEIGGQGLTSDGYHIAAPDPEGSGVQRAIKFALQNSGLSTKDIVHLNAHATSTPAGDVAEANALRKALGSDADHVAVSATKSMTGHLLGGAGAIESVFIVKALQDRLAPPTINIENLDPAVTVDVVRDTPRHLYRESHRRVDEPRRSALLNLELSVKALHLQQMRTSNLDWRREIQDLEFH
jgi:3-oxoacyl-[acyl-carrier-protein] synthase II